MKWLLVLLPLAAAMPAPQGDFKSEAPPPGQVKIRGVTYGGNGCPQGTVSSTISEDKSIMTLIFDSYIAAIGPTLPVTESRKNCQLNVDIQYPGGFQYSILSADYRGFTAIDKGIEGTLKSTYYFSGQTKQTSTEYKFKGPIQGDYLKHDEADSTSVVWSPCGTNGMLNVNSQVRLSNTSKNPKAEGLLTTDSTDLKFTQVVYVQWQKCKTPKQ